MKKKLKVKRCNILVNGLLYSGSGAIVDLLKEYDNIHVINHEFNDFRAPGLVGDQLNYNSSIDFPNQIYKLTKFRRIIGFVFKSIPKFSWELYQIKRYGLYFNFMGTRLYQLYRLNQLNRCLKSDIPFDVKIQKSNEWIHRIGGIFSINKKYVLFDQPIMLGADINVWTKVFNPYKLIYVYRNPKDQLADIIRSGCLFPPFGAPFINLAGITLETIYGRDRKGAIRFHIEAIQKRLEQIGQLKADLSPENFLLIDFEGLVNNPETYISVIENFIPNISDNHKFKYKYFKPSLSRKNISIYKDYLSIEEMEYLAKADDLYNNMITSSTIGKNTSLK